MKKLVLIFLILIACSSESETTTVETVEAPQELQQVSNTTTTTVLEIIEWEKSKVEIKTCPTAEELQIDFNHLGKISLNFEATLGDNVSRITYQLTVNETLADEYTLDNTNPTFQKDKGEVVQGAEQSFLLTRDLSYLKYEVTVYESAGSFTTICETINDIDFNNLPPFVYTTSCPTSIKQGELLVWGKEIIGRSYDVSYIEYELVADTYTAENAVSDKSLLPEKDYKIKGLNNKWQVAVLDYEYNIMWKATVVDVTGLSRSVVCGTRATK